jgi:hypothetical protein
MKRHRNRARKSAVVSRGRIAIKQEYNFSTGERGKFYNAEAQLEIPIDLEHIARIETILPFRQDTGWDSTRS